MPTKRMMALLLERSQKVAKAKREQPRRKRKTRRRREPTPANVSKTTPLSVCLATGLLVLGSRRLTTLYLCPNSTPMRISLQVKSRSTTWITITIGSLALSFVQRSNCSPLTTRSSDGQPRCIVRLVSMRRAGSDPE